MSANRTPWPRHPIGISKSPRSPGATRCCSEPIQYATIATSAAKKLHRLDRNSSLTAHALPRTAADAAPPRVVRDGPRPYRAAGCARRRGRRREQSSPSPNGVALEPPHRSKDQGIVLRPGDSVEVRTPGGGGYGPASRSCARPGGKGRTSRVLHGRARRGMPGFSSACRRRTPRRSRLLRCFARQGALPTAAT